jgi:uncharacterized protein YbjQ (UPF0145 family)
MAEDCGNCGAKLAVGSAFRMTNERQRQTTVDFVNFINGTDWTELCGRCADGPLTTANAAIQSELVKENTYADEHVLDFPMFTVSSFPANVDVRFMNMITANVTVGTGFINEFSQSLSDLTGATNVSTGMSFKANKGEATARSILVAKAVSMGANCIIGVDIDYGVTVNNAATVNMQGTAALVSNLDAMMTPVDQKRAEKLTTVFARMQQLHRWQNRDFVADAANEVA